MHKNTGFYNILMGEETQIIKWLKVYRALKNQPLQVARIYTHSEVDFSESSWTGVSKNHKRYVKCIDPAGIVSVGRIVREVWREDLARIVERTKESAETVARERGAVIIAKTLDHNYPGMRRDKEYLYLYREIVEGSVARCLTQGKGEPLDLKRL